MIDIYTILNKGEDNAIHQKDICEAYDLEPRYFQELVRRERLEGLPICATSKGYFLPETIEELKRTISRFYKQARELRKVAEKMKESAEKFALCEKSEDFYKMAEATRKRNNVEDMR